jgi:hypothetical protein
MNSIICSAIQQHNVLHFYYNGGFRFVEPFCYGLGTSGHELLRGYQISGYSESQGLPPWRLFKVDEIQSLTIADSHFTIARPDYNPDDSAMQHIYCRF